MIFNPDKHHRRSIRLKNYDYTTKGAYFVTICTHEKECILGEIINGDMIINKIGNIVVRHWIDIPKHFSNFIIDEFVVMPNHVHGIIVIQKDKKGHSSLSLNCAPTNNQQISNNSRKFGGMIHGSLSSIVRTYKSLTTRYINISLNTKGKRIWQRNFKNPP